MSNPATNPVDEGVAFVGRTDLTVQAIAPGKIMWHMSRAGYKNLIGTMYARALCTLIGIFVGALRSTHINHDRPAFAQDPAIDRRPFEP